MTTGVITDFVTVSRNSTATYWGEGGTLMTAAANQPRLEIDPVTGDRRGILIEESRTNVSVNFQGYNTLRASMTSIANQKGLNLFRFTPDTSTASSHQTTFNSNFSALSVDTPIAVSLVVKRDGTATSRVAFRVADTVGFRVYLYFDLVNGTWLAGQDNTAITSYSAASLGDGFWEIKFVYIARATSTYATLQVYAASPDSIAVTAYTFNGADSYILAHPQIEVNASFCTSYIPTTTAQATRAAESASIQNTGWLKVSTSTVVIECTTFATLGALAAERRTLFFFNGPNSNSFEAFFATTGTFQILGSDNTLGGAGRIGNPAIQYQKTVVALAYGNDGVAGSVNGSAVAELTSGRPAPLSLTSFFVGSRGSNRHLNGHIRSFSYIPQRVTNQRLQQLSAA